MPTPAAPPPKQTVAAVVSEVGETRPASKLATMEIHDGSQEEEAHNVNDAPMADAVAGLRVPRVSRPDVDNAMYLLEYDHSP